MTGIPVLIFVTLLVSIGETRKIDSIYTDKYQLTYYNDGVDSVSFCEALVACSELGAGSRLVKVNEEDTQTQMNWMLEYWGHPLVWIGATDMRSEGLWYWVDGTSFRYGYTNWGFNQPNSGADENCAASGISSSEDVAGMWHDYSCSGDYGYVCQRSISTARSLSAVSTTKLTYSDTPTSLANAQKECESKGARLARVYNGHYEDILRILPKENGTKYWIKDESSEHGCAVMSYNRWQTHECNGEQHGFVCESDEETLQE
uniref:macrophage mannose receptor 1-like n=1 Tax=Styela clava TaxID=7725 RepID=UPI001939AFB1|nr:macrophage mannose receptor 1-like [Styela clava]